MLAFHPARMRRVYMFPVFDSLKLNNHLNSANWRYYCVKFLDIECSTVLYITIYCVIMGI